MTAMKTFAVFCWVWSAMHTPNLSGSLCVSSVELPPLSAANDQSADLDNNTKQQHLKWCQCNVMRVNALGIKVKRGDKTQKQETRRNNSINRSRNAKERAKSGRSTVKARHGLLSNISDRTAVWTGEEGSRGVDMSRDDNATRLT